MTLRSLLVAAFGVVCFLVFAANVWALILLLPAWGRHIVTALLSLASVSWAIEEWKESRR